MFCLKERPYPGRLLIIFWCDSDNKNFGEWFSIIDEFWLPNVCGAGKDASSAPQQVHF